MVMVSSGLTSIGLLVGVVPLFADGVRAGKNEVAAWRGAHPVPSDVIPASALRQMIHCSAFRDLFRVSQTASSYDRHSARQGALPASMSASPRTAKGRKT